MDLLTPNSATLPVNGTEEYANTILFDDYSPALLMFASIVCIIYIFIGVPGNLITILALARCKKVRNATAVFIINLSLSDLLFCCFNLPLQASTFYHNKWRYGDLLCRLFPLLRYGLVAVSLFSILAITINRYVMIGHPRIYPRIYRRHYLGIMVAGTWICAFGTLLPTWRGIWGKFGLDPSIGSCTILPNNDRSPKEFLFIMAFALPCLSIVLCYARIFYIVRKTAMRTHDPGNTSNSMKIPQSNKKNNNHQQQNHQTAGSTPAINKAADVPNHHNGGAENRMNHIQITDENLQNEKFENVTKELHGVSISRNSSSKQPTRPYLSSINNFKFIDTSFDSDQLLPPTAKNLVLPDNSSVLDKSLHSSTTSINKTVEFTQHVNVPPRNGHLQEVDSAFEVSTTSSSDNNQTNPNGFNNTNGVHDDIQVAVQAEPSTSSGIDIPHEDNNSPKREKRNFVKNLRQSTRFKRKKNSEVLRKLSTAASGASIIYPGRMTTKDRRLLKMILVIFISFLCCYLPITITKLFQSVTEIHFINIMGYILIYLTTCINPIIYVVMSSEYRQAYRNLILCRINGRVTHDIRHKGSQRNT